MAQVVTVNDVLDGHVALDLECLDRIYLNAYVPVLQTSAQVVAFLHLGIWASGASGVPVPVPVAGVIPAARVPIPPGRAVVC